MLLPIHIYFYPYRVSIKSQTHRRRADNTQIKNAVIGSFFLVTLISRRFFKTDSGGLLETMTNNAAVSGGTVVLFLYTQNQTNYFLSKKRSVRLGDILPMNMNCQII